MKPQNYSTIKRNVLLDEFLTPIELIEACVQTALVPRFDRFVQLHVCDVGSNDGRWGKVVRKYFPNAIITGIELMSISQPAEYDIWINGDFITTDLTTQEIFLGNPPFTVKRHKTIDGILQYKEDGTPEIEIVYKAQDFVEKALQNVFNYGYVMYLLRSNFRHSVERYWDDGSRRTDPGLFQRHMYQESYNFTLRPSYYKEDSRTKGYNTKQTNAHDNAFFVFTPAWKMPYAIERHLDWCYL